MENNIIENFKRLKEELENRAYSREQQLNILIPLFKDITNSMLDLLKSEKEKYDDFVAKFQFLRAIKELDAEYKERYYKAERYTKNNLEFLANKTLETVNALNEIIQGVYE